MFIASTDAVLESTQQLLARLKCLSDPSRLRLLALCRHGECSVSELAQVIGQSQPRVSQHLRQLVEAGLLERFRDGRRVFYRLPAAGARSGTLAGLMALVPAEEPVLAADARRLQRARAAHRLAPEADAVAGEDRTLHRVLMDLTVTTPLGDLLDIGCGRGRMLKLLATRANRAVGVDIDADARALARAELLLAGLPNCSLRQGDMYGLPFADAEFDTIILDDVLGEARRPARVLLEAKRLLRAGGRVIVLARVRGGADGLKRQFAEWFVAVDWRLSPARYVPPGNPEWLVAVASVADGRIAAA